MVGFLLPSHKHRPAQWGELLTTTTVEIDLLSLSCVSPDLSKVQSVYVWFSGGGTFYVDAVRAE